MNTDRLVSRLALALILAEILLVLLSWLLSAMDADGVRPLLSAEGVRWFFAHFSDFIASRWLAWLLLCAMAGGCLADSQLWRPGHVKAHRQGAIIALIVLLVYVGVLMMLTVIPHAALLSATGSLWPSPFSRALVPVMAFGIILISAGYGLVTRAFVSFADVCQALARGIARSAPLLLLYVLTIQLLESLRFAFF